MAEHASWFWYGRFEGACGGYVPPRGFVAALLYTIGNIVGRRFGPPAAPILTEQLNTNGERA